MNEKPKPGPPRRRLVGHDHKKQSLRVWVIPLLVILGIIYFLPKIVALLEK